MHADVQTQVCSPSWSRSGRASGIGSISGRPPCRKPARAGFPRLRPPLAGPGPRQAPPSAPRRRRCGAPPVCAAASVTTGAAATLRYHACTEGRMIGVDDWESRRSGGGRLCRHETGDYNGRSAASGGRPAATAHVSAEADKHAARRLSVALTSTWRLHRDNIYHTAACVSCDSRAPDKKPLLIMRGEIKRWGNIQVCKQRREGQEVRAGARACRRHVWVFPGDPARRTSLLLSTLRSTRRYNLLYFRQQCNQCAPCNGRKTREAVSGRHEFRVRHRRSGRLFVCSSPRLTDEDKGEGTPPCLVRYF